MINIILPNGNILEFSKKITGLEIAEKISKSLSKEALLIEIDGEIRDLSYVIEKDSVVKIITSKDKEEILEYIRHDAAHILAAAVCELFDNVQVTIGPATKEGFYYDFAREEPFSSDDLIKIEKQMHKIVKRNDEFIREEWQREEAIEFFKNQGQFYKAEIIESIPENQIITLYKQGDFIDLCRGPHFPSTGKVKYFKLLKLAGAYWRGDSNNQMLQRIYGTAFATKEELDSYLFMLEESKKRDHRKLGKELELFHLQEEAQGSVFWHNNGYAVYKILQQYIRNKLFKSGYIEVNTPTMVDVSLWKKSGHYDKFYENMFFVSEGKPEEKTENHREYALKPMNCPCHIEIFKQSLTSYKDLPIRMAEFGSCYRNEASGALHGLLRVRNFVQDDAHIFCMQDQINSETVAFCNLLLSVYRDFGFNEVSVKFSTRPEKRAGTEEIWDKAEDALENAVKETGLSYEIQEGEGAFYGPKLEFVLKDAVGRSWQCGTIQVDFILPQRLNAYYIDHNNEKQNVVMLHRAIIGTFERFIGVLIEEYAGKFPLWLAPTQIAIVAITNDFDDYITNMNQKFINLGIRSLHDTSTDKISYKIRKYSNLKIPLIAIIGEKEIQNNSINIRKLGSNDTINMSFDQLVALIKKENERYL